jgi:enoyl-CoA hydratase/carnithine racemase
MTEALLITRPADGVALLTLNRPEVMNAVDMALFEALTATLDDLATDNDVRAIVVTGAGERAFSAGFDIHEMAGFDHQAMKGAFQKRDRLFLQVAEHPKPIICALNGVTYGAGALMAAAADLRLGSPAMRFKVTASSYGAANATWTLPKLVGVPKAKEILYTGRVVLAEEALAIGLINHLVADGPVAGAAIEMAAAIAANEAEGVQAIKALVNGGLTRGYPDGWQAEYDWMVDHMGPSRRGGAQLFTGFLAKRTAPAG